MTSLETYFPFGQVVNTSSSFTPIQLTMLQYSLNKPFGTIYNPKQKKTYVFKQSEPEPSIPQSSKIILIEHIQPKIPKNTHCTTSTNTSCEFPL